MSLITDQVDELFTQWDSSSCPGCIVAVIQDGQMVYQCGYGMANLEYSIPISPSSVFDIGSTAKQFTAMCIALLARQNLLSLDDELQEYIPEIPRYGHPVTIQNLIYHTSGLRDYPELMKIAGMFYKNSYSNEEILTLISRQKSLNFEPGTEYLYSNSGYFLLGQIVKRVSGKSLRLFAEEHIFAPLGMRNTRFHDDFREVVKNRAVGYELNETGSFQIKMSLLDVTGAGGVYTTINDLFLWDQNFYSNRLSGCGRGLVEEVTTSGKLNNGRTINYAFGLMLDKYRGLKIISHSGMWMGYRNDIIRFPDQNFSVIFLANSSEVNPTQSALQVANIYLENEFTEADTKSNLNSIKFIDLSLVEEIKTGFYRSLKTKDVCRVRIKDKKLMIKGMRTEYRLVPIAFERFRLVDDNFVSSKLAYKFPVDADQMIVEFDVGNGELQYHIWEKLSVARSIVLTDYLGSYYSDEVEYSYQMILEGEKLYVRGEYSFPLKIEPIEQDLFWMDGSKLGFVRNADNQITGFNLCGSRVRQLYFTKLRVLRPK